MVIEEISISTIIGVVKGVKIFAEYLGFIESLEAKIDKLINSELDTAIKALKEAKSTTSPEEYKTILRESRIHFRKATTLEDTSSMEKTKRLIAAYVGLAMCHYRLEDYGNAKQTLYDFAELDLAPSWKEILTRTGLGAAPFASPAIGPPQMTLVMTAALWGLGIWNAKNKENVFLPKLNVAAPLIEEIEKLQSFQSQAKEFADQI